MDLSRVTIDDIEITHMKRYHFEQDIHPSDYAHWDVNTPGYSQQLDRLREQLEAIPNVHLAVVRPRAIDIFLLDNDRSAWEETNHAVHDLLGKY
ncbi:hypothetical protein D3C72_1810430 [compost metagenome]